MGWLKKCWVSPFSWFLVVFVGVKNQGRGVQGAVCHGAHSGAGGGVRAFGKWHAKSTLTPIAQSPNGSEMVLGHAKTKCENGLK